jgi:23S rRNA (guanosine2251-2'-O)-methyltransferase
MKKIVLILCDVRSCYNVGSIFRTADAVGSTEIVLCGITPHPRLLNDARPEKVIENNSKMIHKTALGAEESVRYSYQESPLEAINKYKSAGCQVVALENKMENTENIFDFKSAHDLIIVVGSETNGLNAEALGLCSNILEIPMNGIKNSLNVSVAVGIALYALI